jgi:hypothetical protein
MKKSTAVRTKPASFTALAVLTLLAILVAPICAPLCAASACASGANQGQCHEVASTSASGSEQVVAANKACESSDFSAVLVKSDEKPFWLQSVRSYSTLALSSHSAEKVLRALPANAGDVSVHLVPLQLADSRSMTTILRI